MPAKGKRSRGLDFQVVDQAETFVFVRIDHAAEFVERVAGDIKS
jgi:hypothetical protein